MRELDRFLVSHEKIIHTVEEACCPLCLQEKEMIDHLLGSVSDFWSSVVALLSMAWIEHRDAGAGCS